MAADRSLRPLRLAVLACSLAAIAGMDARLALAAWDPIPPEAWREPARPDSGGGDAIVLLERQECRQRSSSFSTDYFVRGRVFTADGRDAGNIEIFYVKKSWKLSNLRARSVRPDGGSVELDPATVITTTAWKFRDYEIEKATVAIPGIEPGCIIECGYSLEGPQGYFGGWRFPFSNTYYTCRSEQVWKVPADAWGAGVISVGMRPVLRYANLFPSRVEERYEPDPTRPTTVTLTARGLEGVRGEAFAPPEADARPSVELRVEARNAETTTHWGNWKDAFDEWQKALGKDANRLDTQVAEFRNGRPDPESALRAAFAWVQSTYTCIDEQDWATRHVLGKRSEDYRFVQSFSELLKRHELSSFEINVLMVAIAGKLGLTASLGMTGNRELQRFDSRSMGFPPENFVTRVVMNGQVVFLQPSSRFAAFGSLPWNLRGGDCLLSGSSADLICHIPPEVGEPAWAAWSLDLDVSPDGAVGGRVMARLWGEEGAEWKRGLWEVDPASWKQWLAGRLAVDGGPKATFEDPKVDAPGDSVLWLRATAAWPTVAVAEPNRIEIPCEKLVPWRTGARFLLDRRTQPVLIRYPRDEMVSMNLHLPAGFTVAALPPRASFANEIGNWSERWYVEDGVPMLERHVTLVRAEVPQRLYPAVRDFFNSLDHADHAVLVAEKAR